MDETQRKDIDEQFDVIELLLTSDELTLLETLLMAVPEGVADSLDEEISGRLWQKLIFAHEDMIELRKPWKILRKPTEKEQKTIKDVAVAEEASAEHYSGGYMTIIRLKDSVSGDLLRSLTETIEKAFVNRAGSLQNTGSNPREFIFQGGEEYYGCLDLGMFYLREVPGVMPFIKTWEWVDEDPDENCDMLEVFARYPLLAEESYTEFVVNDYRATPMVEPNKNKNRRS